ncbi:MAG: hypothetical protein HY290_18975 [Planctomycetia bacterium]|nr:hypothetical protein [Planctomycetia bacterium]
MNPTRLLALVMACTGCGSAILRAADVLDAKSRDEITKAVERGVPVLEKAARSYPTHRQCFACHHQTLPLLGLGEARKAGITTDEKLPAEIVEFTCGSFRSKLDDLNAGEKIGGKGLTVGYAAWTLKLGATIPDELTDAMTAFLLKTQEDDGHWGLHAIRPPAEESLVVCTVVAAAGLKVYARNDRVLPATTAIDKARNWLATAKIESQEDRMARLWGCRLLGTNDEDLAAARQAVISAQRDDGGWGQTSEMPSDPYATGTTLYVLLDTGLATGHPSVNRAVAYLVKAQKDDGSWLVETRAKPVQVFFDNGDPHGKSQFISIAATGWSVAALARSLQPSASRGR